MKYHEYANLFPMMPEPDLMRLAEDIKEKGLSDPIITLDGMILDGRNRYKACGINSITPRFEEYAGDDPLGYVVSHNLHRRHLSESQRAMVAAKWAGLKHGSDTFRGNQYAGAKSPIGDSPKPSATATRDEAAALLNVGTSSIDRAKKVIKDAPELVEKIESGEMSVNAAYVSTKHPAEDSPPDPVIVDGISEEAPATRRSPLKIIESEGMRIWLLAKSHLDRINKNDEFREQALNACAEYCQKRISAKK